MPAAKPPEFRCKALDLVARGEPGAQLSKGLGIGKGILRRWMPIGAVDQGRVGGLTSAANPILVELRRETRVLEMENEILKRASA